MIKSDSNGGNIKSDSNGAYKGCEVDNESKGSKVASDSGRICGGKESKCSNEITSDSGRGYSKSLSVSEISKKFGGQNKYILRKNVKFDPKSPKTAIKSDKKKCKEIKMKLEGLNKNDKKCEVESPLSKNKNDKTNKVAKLVEALNENVTVKDSEEFKYKKGFEAPENAKTDKKNIKNVFKTMMESRKGVESKNITPRRNNTRKRLGSTDGQKGLQEWLKLKRK